MPELRSANSSPPLPPFTPGRSVLFGVGVGVPVVTAILMDATPSALFAGVGAFLALMTDPRRTIGIRAIAILMALAALVAAGALGVALHDNQAAVAVAVLAIAFLAGLPKPVFPYLTLVGKMAAAFVIVTATGFAATTAAAGAFVAGGLFALAASLVEFHWRNVGDAGTSPIDEWRAVWSGDTNPLFYAISLSATVALAMIIAVGLHANLPGWVGLTVLFVMHPDDAMAVRLMAQRIGGTLVGIALAGVVVYFVHAPSLLAALAILAAALLPKAMSANFFWLSSVVTVLIMVLLDLALLATGGDAPLLKWRLYDTLLGCLAVAIALSAIRLFRRWQPRIRPRAERAAEADPPDAPAPPVDPGTQV